MKDDTNDSQINQRDKIMEKIEDFYKSTLGIGKNPFTVNVISFSG